MRQQGRSLAEADLFRQLGVCSPAAFRNEVYGSAETVKRLVVTAEVDVHRGCINSLDFSSDGSRLVSTGDDCKLTVTDVGSTKTLTRIDTVRCALLAPD